MSVKEIKTVSTLLFFGVLLMSAPISPLHASDSHADRERLLTDFTSNSVDLDWYVVNDNAVGGRSEGDFEQEQGKLNFAGSTNTNGGGFSSTRTRSVQLDLSNHAGVQLEVKGDGRRNVFK